MPRNRMHQGKGSAGKATAILRNLRIILRELIDTLVVAKEFTNELIPLLLFWSHAILLILMLGKLILK